MYEVELKFPVADHREVISRLTAWGARPERSIDQSDTYFNHPQRDFGTTDEALRLRAIGDQNLITYKGPVVDAQTKMRQEIEIPFGTGRDAAVKFGEILMRLGFRAVRVVRKTRTPWHLREQERDFEIALDSVHGLGLFVEIETQSDESQRDAARDAVLQLATRLGLTQPERRSYLCLLLEMQGAAEIQS